MNKFHRIKEKILFLFVLVVFVAVAFFVYNVFIVREFARVTVHVYDDHESITTDPEGLLLKKQLRPIESVLMYIDNATDRPCVAVILENSEQSPVNVDAHGNAGAIFLVKGKVNEIQICGRKIGVDLRSL